MQRRWQEATSYGHGAVAPLHYIVGPSRQALDVHRPGQPLVAPRAPPHLHTVRSAAAAAPSQSFLPSHKICHHRHLVLLLPSLLQHPPLALLRSAKDDRSERRRRCSSMETTETTMATESIRPTRSFVPSQSIESFVHSFLRRFAGGDHQVFDEMCDRVHVGYRWHGEITDDSNFYLVIGMPCRAVPVLCLSLIRIDSASSCVQRAWEMIEGIDILVAARELLARSIGRDKVDELLHTSVAVSIRFFSAYVP